MQIVMYDDIHKTGLAKDLKSAITIEKIIKSCGSNPAEHISRCLIVRYQPHSTNFLMSGLKVNIYVVGEDIPPKYRNTYTWY